MQSTQDAITTSFAALGARVKVVETDRPFSIDIRDDGHGEIFHLMVQPDVRPTVADVCHADRHLLLTIDGPGAQTRKPASTYLCGRDERHWFVAAVPEEAEARDVQAAKDALKPQAVWDAMRERQVPPEHRDRRRTTAFIRQGEWFFIPRPALRINTAQALQNEPIQRGAGKPHRCQFLYRPRESGETVWVCAKYPNGLTEREYYGLPKAERRRSGWQLRTRNARVYVKGNIRHPDHKTVWLSAWHEVVMNTETESLAMANLAFLD